MKSNPLTYSERVDMITRVLNGEGIKRQQYSFKRFYIDEPEKIESEGISRDWIFFTTVREEWNREKISTLESIGFNVRILYEDYSEDRITSTNIREMIAICDNAWKDVVPELCVKYLEEIDFRHRLINI